MARTAQRVQAPSNGEEYIPTKDLNYYHVELERPVFSPKTGERLSTPYVQIFSENEYKKLLENKSKLGFSTKLLYKPKK